MKRIIGFFILALAVLAVRQAGAAEHPTLNLPDYCQFDPSGKDDRDSDIESVRHLSQDCRSMREEAEDYFAKAHLTCSYVIFISWEGSTETVRCRLYGGGVVDYKSDAAGNLRETYHSGI